MNAALMESRPWPRRRWWLLVMLVFAAHLFLIFTLGDRRPILPRRPAAVPVLRLAGESDELLALNDPTLFALPHRMGFAGAAWLQISPAPPLPAFAWTDPPSWLALPTNQLGGFFARFMETNRFAPFQPALKPPLELTEPELAPEPVLAADSELRIEGDLARRRLLKPMVLPWQPSPDILTNSVVQVVVDAAGRVLSCMLPAGSGSTNADRCALDLARAARFEPLVRDGASGAANPAAGLSWGRMIFEWRTTPLPATPAPAAAP